MRTFLRQYLNRYALFDVLVIAAAIAFGFGTGKIVYTSRCEALGQAMRELLPIAEEALALHQREIGAKRDTIEMLRGPVVTPETEDDR